MRENRIISEEYTKIGEEIIEKAKLLEHLNNFYGGGDVKIIFLESDKQKMSHNRIIYAECEKISDTKRWAIPADFTITVFTKNMSFLDDDQKKAVILHELMHVGVEGTNKGIKTFLIPHDVQDFYYILKKYSLDWNRSNHGLKDKNGNQLEFDF